LLSVKNIFTVEHDLTFSALARVEVIHAIQSAQQGGLTATRWANESGDGVLLDIEIDVFKAVK